MNEWKTKALRLFEVKQELEAENDQLKAENERLRKALEEIAMDILFADVNTEVELATAALGTANLIKAALKEQEHE